MTNRERLSAVLSGKTPDRIPFMPFKDVMPDSPFLDDLINRGMGLIYTGCSVESKTLNCEIETVRSGDALTLIYHTPKGKVSVKYDGSHGQITGNPYGVQTEFMIKSELDYDAAIYIIDNTQYEQDTEAFSAMDKSVGGNGFIHAWTDEPPYMDAQYFLGLESWSFEQYDNPDAFAALLSALDRRQERRMMLILDGPDYFINLGNLAGNFGPAEFERYMLPYFQKHGGMMRENGKITTIHADANNLAIYRGLVAKCDISVIEAFTPPPFGDLSLKDARKAWGDDKTIWINFPESVFYDGYDATKAYAIELIRSDPCPNKFISFTEMGMLGVTDKNSKIFEDGITAIMDALDEAGDY